MTNVSFKHNHTAFTLIELLMVVAIIAILAAIAIPNMLEAQIRSKVSRVHAELRTLATAIETYRVDANNYPPENFQGPELVQAYNNLFIPNAIKLRPLTTPIAYISTLPVDLFDPGTDEINQVAPHTYHYVSINDPLYPSTPLFHGANEERARFSWILQSYGPDRGSDVGTGNTYWQFPRYDPTNGTVSIGNILRWGP